MKIFVSIIIPAFNEGEVIERLLKSIKNQTHKNTQVIVVDDGSEDDTYKIAKKYTGFVFKNPKRSERSFARNFGAKKAKGKYLLFLDADMELKKDLVEKCLLVFRKNKKVGALVIPEKSVANTFWEKVKAHERTFYNLEGDSEVEAARFFTRKAFIGVGGYDEKITGPEDWLLPDSIKKKGYEIGRVGDTLIYHFERIPSLLSLAKKKFYYGIKASVYFKKANKKPIGAKTIYFLRPVFYKNWKLLVSKPILSIAMVWMFVVEIVAGGFGYIYGLVKK